MRRFFVILSVLVSWFCGNAQELDSIAYFDPDEVFVVANDVESQERLAACQMVAGEWQYDKPYVHADGASVMGKLGKPIAKSKIKKKLEKAYKKMKINKRWSSMTLTEDSEWKMKVLGLSFGGSYTYDPEQEQLTLRWHGIPLKSHTHRDGKKLYIAFDMDRLLVVLSFISSMSSSETLKSLSFLSQNFRNVTVGFEMKAILKDY
ncbi:MAG: DUF4923 family protein [Muribaculaceae bacterium]|nr:DUF4923 family protein [Muribaculaceae bacterium]